MTTISKLVVSLSLKDREYKSGMSNAAKLAQDTAAKIGKIGQGLNIGGIGSKFAALGNQLSGALGKVGPIAAKAGAAVKAGMAVAATATVAAAAVIAAGVAGIVVGFAAVTMKALGLAKAAAPIQGLRASFNALTQDIAGGSAAMMAALQQASAGMITNTDLMQKFNLASQLVSSDFAQTLPSAIEKIGKVAQATGQDFDFLLNSYITATGRLSPMIADNLAITVDAAQANAVYADEIGTTVEALTKQQRQTAFANEMLRQLEKNTAGLPPVFGSAQQVFKAFEVSLQNIRDDVGMDLLPTFTELFQLFNRFTPALRAFGQGFAGAFAGVFNVGKSLVKGLARSLGVDFDAIASNSEQWGANIVTQLARGMARAIGAVIQVLQVLGQAIAGWLAPGSPPALLPDLPDWGQSAGEWFLKGMANANVNILRDLSRNVESFLRSSMSGSSMQDIATAVLQAREAIFEAVSTGTTADVLGVLPPELQSYASSLIAVEQAAQDVAAAQEQVAASQNAVTAAQEALNAVTQRYEGLLSPISARLREIQDERDEFVEGQRRDELQQIIADATAAGDMDAAHFAQLELEELDLQDQQAELESMQAAEEAAAAAGISAAEEQLAADQAALEMSQAAQEAAEQQLQIQQEMLAHLVETNNLMADAAAQMTETGAAAGGAAAGVGGLADALGDLGTTGGVVAGGLSQTMSELAASIMGEFDGVSAQAETLGETWGRVFTNAKGKLEEIKNTVLGWKTSLITWFGEVKTNLETGLQTAVATFRNWWAEKWDSIQQKITDVWGAIKPLWDDMQNFIHLTLIPAATAIQTKWAQETWPAIERAVGKAWESILGVFKEIDRWVNVNLVPFGQLLKNVWVHEVWEPIASQITDAWNKSIQPVFDDIATWYGKTIVPLMDTAGEAWDRVWAAAAQKVSDVKGDIFRFFDRIEAFANWLTTHVFSFSISIPDLPQWVQDLINGANSNYGDGGGTSSKGSGKGFAGAAIGGALGGGGGMGGFTFNNYGDINNGMDLAAFDARVRRLIREEMGAR